VLTGGRTAAQFPWNTQRTWIKGVCSTYTPLRSMVVEVVIAVVLVVAHFRLETVS